MGFTTLSLKGRALRLLSQREHSRAELLRKLAPHVEEGDDLHALLDDLQARDFISETRVAESVLHRRAGRLGAARIRQELQSKGLGAEAVQDAVAPAAGFLLQHLSLLFVPVGVGVMTHLALLSTYGLQLVAVIVLSTWVGMAVTAQVLRLLQPKENHGELR